MTYDPVAYWQAAGTDRDNIEHESRYVRTDAFRAQEEALLDVLATLDMRSVLEVGCGWGRIAQLVTTAYPLLVSYVGVDLSPERIDSARQKVSDGEFFVSTLADFKSRKRWDVVLAVEFLMHQTPDDVGEAVRRLRGFARHHLVTLDWTADLGAAPIAPWNFRHDYAALFGDALESTVVVGKQSIHVVKGANG